MDINFETNSKVQDLVTKLMKRAALRELNITRELAQQETENAILEYYNDRHFTPSEEQPFEKLYEGIILQLALSAITKMGAEGETMHTEGGVIRTYNTGADYPLDLTRKIIPLAKTF